MSLRVAAALVLATLLVAPQASADADGDEVVKPPPKPIQTRAYVRGQGGYAYHVLYGVPVDSGNFDLALGLHTSLVAYFFEANFLFGSTRDGLAVHGFELGPSVELALWRFRFGHGFFMSNLRVARVTNSAELTALNTGVSFHLTFDLVQWGREQEQGWGRSGGVFVGARVSTRFADASYTGGEFYAGVRAF